MSIVKKRLEALAQQINKRYKEEGSELEVQIDNGTGKEHEYEL